MTKDDFKYHTDFADFETPTFERYEDEEVPISNKPYIDGVDDIDTDDQYVDAQLRVPIDDEIKSRKVVRHKRELDGTVKG
jgi:hypothetical protein